MSLRLEQVGNHFEIAAQDDAPFAPADKTNQHITPADEFTNAPPALERTAKNSIGGAHQSRTRCYVRGPEDSRESSSRPPAFAELVFADSEVSGGNDVRAQIVVAVANNRELRCAVGCDHLERARPSVRGRSKCR